MKKTRTYGIENVRADSGRKLGENLSQHRECLGISIASLAERLGVETTSVSDFEQGIELPSEEVLERYYEVLRVGDDTRRYWQALLFSALTGIRPASLREGADVPNGTPIPTTVKVHGLSVSSQTKKQSVEQPKKDYASMTTEELLALNDEDFGHYVATGRKKLGWSQDYLGEKLGIAKVTVSGWENNRYSPRPNLRKQIIHVLQKKEASVGAGIRRRRRYLGLSVKSLSTQAGISTVTVGQVENDQPVSEKSISRILSTLSKLEANSDGKKVDLEALLALNDEDFGHYVAAERKKLGWSQTVLGRRARCSSDYISRIERASVGISKHVRARIIYALNNTWTKGEQLRQRRKTLGLTQRILGKHIDADSTDISRLELYGIARPKDQELYDKLTETLTRLEQEQEQRLRHTRKAEEQQIVEEPQANAPSAPDTARSAKPTEHNESESTKLDSNSETRHTIDELLSYLEWTLDDPALRRIVPMIYDEKKAVETLDLLKTVAKSPNGLEIMRKTLNLV
ncbi:helix-turn-helix domain-containing protein [Candidatus Saccharibacteria bacterium]|nr:helix-turn-helix domain-containing protein [Candidatus Saccharibacteria bacterium]